MPISAGPIEFEEISGHHGSALPSPAPLGSGGAMVAIGGGVTGAAAASTAHINTGPPSDISDKSGNSNADKLSLGGGSIGGASGGGGGSNVSRKEPTGSGRTFYLKKCFVSFPLRPYFFPISYPHT